VHVLFIITIIIGVICLMINFPNARNATLVFVGLCMMLGGVIIIANHGPPPKPAYTPPSPTAVMMPSEKELSIRLTDLGLRDVLLTPNIKDMKLSEPQESYQYWTLDMVVTNNSAITLTDLNFEVTVKDGKEVIAQNTAGSCNGHEFKGVPPGQVRAWHSCAVHFSGMPPATNAIYGYRITAINGNSVVMNTVFQRTVNELPAEQYKAAAPLSGAIDCPGLSGELRPFSPSTFMNCADAVKRAANESMMAQEYPSIAPPSRIFAPPLPGSDTTPGCYHNDCDERRGVVPARYMNIVACPRGSVVKNCCPIGYTYEPHSKACRLNPEQFIAENMPYMVFRTLQDLHLLIAPNPYGADVLPFNTVIPKGTDLTLTFKCEVWKGSSRRTAPDADNIWCPVNYGQARGWVNAYWLESPVLPGRLACLIFDTARSC
jgi:hypothetical protein